ncbi:MAG: hypothetical protein ACYS1A_09055 [Planctomycetota bacterium]|jgi:hypothetical protein
MPIKAETIQRTRKGQVLIAANGIKFKADSTKCLKNDTEEVKEDKYNGCSP